MDNKNLTGKKLEQALKQGDLVQSGIFLTGWVREAEKKGYISFTGDACEEREWIDLPVDLIEEAEVIGQKRCKEHIHPIVRLKLKSASDSEGQVLRDLLSHQQRNSIPMSHLRRRRLIGRPTFGPGMGVFWGPCHERCVDEWWDCLMTDSVEYCDERLKWCYIFQCGG